MYRRSLEGRSKGKESCFLATVGGISFWARKVMKGDLPAEAVDDKRREEQAYCDADANLYHAETNHQAVRVRVSISGGLCHRKTASSCDSRLETDFQLRAYVRKRSTHRNQEENTGNHDHEACALEHSRVEVAEDTDHKCPDE